MSKKIYGLLGVKETASDEEIRSAWKKLTMKYHPDRLVNATEKQKMEGQEKIKQINAAYELLNDKKKKEMYDKYGDEWLEGNMKGCDENGFGFDPFGFFGNRQQKKKVSVQPIEEVIKLTLKELFFGTKKSKKIRRNILCKPCNGTGSADKKLATCNGCGGRGVRVIIKQMGMMMTQTQTTCDMCRGTGKSSSKVNICTKCKGNPTSMETVEIKVDVEAGLHNGKTIEVNNEGHEYLTEKNEIKRGDIIFVISEEEHPIYKRGYEHNNNKKINMANLIVSIDIDFVEAICGFSREIKYIDDTIFYICETDIIKDGDIKMIPNKGAPYAKNKYKMGDLYIKYNVKTPDNIPQEIKNKLAELFGYKGIQAKTETSMEMTTLKPTMNSYNAYEEEEEREYENMRGQNVQCAQF